MQVDLMSHELYLPSVNEVADKLIKTLGTKEDLERTASVSSIGGPDHLSRLVNNILNNGIPSIMRRAFGMFGIRERSDWTVNS